MYRIIIHKRAARYLQRLPQFQKEIIKAAIKRLTDNPFDSKEVKQMVGNWKGYYRIRVQDVRVIYWVDKENSVIYVDYIGSRGDVYKKQETLYDRKRISFSSLRLPRKQIRMAE